MTKGAYGGGTVGIPWLGGLGGGLYFDNHGRVYPQLYGGTPGFGLSAGYTDNLEGLLTGPSASASVGRGAVRFNGGMSGSASGFGFGTPGVGVTHGFGPLEISQDFSRPWITPAIRDSAAAAGVPSRYNVWEYDYPDSPTTARADATPSRQNGKVVDQGSASPFTSGTSAVPCLPPAAKELPGGLPGLIAAATGNDPFNPTQFFPSAGGLPGLIQDYLRSQALQGGSRP